MNNSALSIHSRLACFAALSFAAISTLLAQEYPPIDLPNEHEFIRLQDVEVIEKDGRSAINGSAFKFRGRFMPWGSHLHIDLIDIQSNDEDEEMDVLVERILYRFRRNDFDDGNKFKRFFKYVDLSNAEIDKIEVETFTQQHNETCGEESEESPNEQEQKKV